MKRIFIVLLMVVAMSTGCKSTYYHARFPELELPKRPVLVNVAPEEMEKLSSESKNAIAGNFNNLIDYCQKMEIAINNYNGYAKEQNAILDNLSKEK